MGLAATASGNLETIADLNTFDGLDAHDRLREQTVDLAVPMHVASETNRQAVRQDFDDAPETVTVLCRRLDLGDHRRLGRLVEATYRRLIDS